MLPVAERVGFEPTIPVRDTAFRERRLQPLGHLSGVCADFYQITRHAFDTQLYILCRGVKQKLTGGQKQINGPVIPPGIGIAGQRVKSPVDSGAATRMALA
jgi:hypothetical protein